MALPNLVPVAERADSLMFFHEAINRLRANAEVDHYATDQGSGLDPLGRLRHS